MTAVTNWDIVGPRETDAELVRASLTGDRAAFAHMYDRYADRLHDFCIGMLRDRDVAADCVQDTFCIAATRLPQLREPDKLRPWLYSIARNEALHRIHERHRETPSEELPDEMSDDPGPETLAARTELADLIAEAAGGLSDRDQTVLELAYRHGLDGPELAEALDVSQTNANTMVGRLRDTIERSLGALLVARRVRGNPARCLELASILDGWDGRFTVLMRKRIARHIESCPTCDDERRRLVSPAALLGATPVFVPAPEWLRDRTLGEVQLLPVDGKSEDGLPHPDGSGRRRRSPGWVLAVAIVAVLGAVLGLTFALMQQKYVEIAPTDASDSVPAPPGNPPPTASTAPAQTTLPAVLPPQTTVVQTPAFITTTVPAPPPDRTTVYEPTPGAEPGSERVPIDPPSAPPSPTGRASQPTPEVRPPTATATLPQDQTHQPRRTSINAPGVGDNDQGGRRGANTRRGS